MKQKTMSIEYIVIFLIFIAIFCSSQYFINLVVSIGQSVNELLSTLNSVSNIFTGYGIIPNLFADKITYMIVGTILSVIAVPFCKRSKRILGKIIYSSLIEYVQIVLNAINKNLFKGL